jgi:hypothetical protein
MGTLTQTNIAALQHQVVNQNLFTKFLNWCENQEEMRIFWQGFGLILHGCFLTPLDFLSVVYSVAIFFLLVSVMFSMAAVLIVNLAALPTKITLPVLALSILTDIAIFTICSVS